MEQTAFRALDINDHADACAVNASVRHRTQAINWAAVLTTYTEV